MKLTSRALCPCKYILALRVMLKRPALGAWQCWEFELKTFQGVVQHLNHRATTTLGYDHADTVHVHLSPDSNAFPSFAPCSVKSEYK